MSLGPVVYDVQKPKFWEDGGRVGKPFPND